MTDPDLVDRLAAHRTLGGVSRRELEWLAAHGTMRHHKTGEVLSTKGAPIDGMYLVLEGRTAIFVDRGAGRHKMLEWVAGDVSGHLPFSRMVKPPGDALALEPTTLFAIHRDCFPELIRECPEVTTLVVHVMLDRARLFTSSELHDEKMVSLGKLSAGLAHELNNPASAIERSATMLQARLAESERASRALGAAHLNDEQLAAVDALHESCFARRSPGVRSPIEQAEREEAISDWLTDHGIDDGIAESLAETAAAIENFEEIAKAVDAASLDAVLHWAAAGFAVRRLASDIQEASTRIAGLVLAIKGFTHMDQAAVAEPVDLTAGLASTVTVLGAKARGKAAAVIVNVEPALPRVRGFAGELNQVWSNLIDNALDAVGDNGRIEVSAGREDDRVVVRVVDDGAGIPADIKERIFDPFFTTKPVGEGTGLGLDIVRRLVRHNDGEITVESKPGRTEFRVALLVADDAADGNGGRA